MLEPYRPAFHPGKLSTKLLIGAQAERLGRYRVSSGPKA